MLEPESIDRWLARDDVEKDRQGLFDRIRDQIDSRSDRERVAIIDLVERIGGEDARDLLMELSDRDQKAERIQEKRSNSRRASSSASTTKRSPQSEMPLPRPL